MRPSFHHVRYFIVVLFICKFYKDWLKLHRSTKSNLFVCFFFFFLFFFVLFLLSLFKYGPGFPPVNMAVNTCGTSFYAIVCISSLHYVNLNHSNTPEI